MFDNLLQQLWFQVTIGFVVYLLLGLLFAFNLKRVQGPEFWAMGDSGRYITNGWHKPVLFVVFALSWLLQAWLAIGSQPRACTAERLREIREALPIVGWYWRRRYRMADTIAADRRFLQQMKLEKRIQEHASREKLREEWLRLNPPQFFYARQNGITAVLSLQDYEKNRRYTEAARLTGEWPHKNVLRLVPETFVFADETGFQQIRSALGDFPVRDWAAELSCLTRVLAAYPGAVFEEKEDIFVPYVNESILPFTAQRTIMRHRHHRSLSSAELVMPQVPKDLWLPPLEEELEAC